MVDDTSCKQDVSTTLLENHDSEKCQPPTAPFQKPPLLFSKRFLIIILIFISQVNMILIRCNMNIAIIEMTSSKQVQKGNETITQPPEFSWDSKMIGIILSIISYGKFFSFLGGPLIAHLGGSVSWSLAMMTCGITTLIQPISLRYNFYLFFFFRFLTGIFDSIYNASILTTFSRWIPKSERGTLMSICVNGINTGIAVVYPISGYVISEGGWTMIFYVTGTISLTLSLVCLILVRNNPSEDKCISKNELSFILRETDTIGTKKAVGYPYKNIVKSAPIWTLCFSYFVTSWLLSVLVYCLPLFIRDLTKKETKDIAFISSIPNFAGIFSSFFAGALLDYWKNNTKTTLTWVYKIMTSTTFVITAVSFVFLTLVSKILIISSIIFVLIRMLVPFPYLVQQLISVSIAPNHTGIVASLTTTWFSISMIVAQMATGFMTFNHTLDEWNNFFLLTAGIIAFGAGTFVSCASSDAQPWSVTPNSKDMPNRANSSDKNELKLIEK